MPHISISFPFAEKLIKLFFSSYLIPDGNTPKQGNQSSQEKRLHSFPLFWLSCRLTQKELIKQTINRASHSKSKPSWNSVQRCEWNNRGGSRSKQLQFDRVPGEGSEILSSNGQDRTSETRESSRDKKGAVGICANYGRKSITGWGRNSRKWIGK